MRRFACLAFGLAACTTSGPGPNAVTVSVVGSPSLIAYRNAGGAWLEPAAGEQPGDYVLGVAGAYTLVVACSDTTGFDTVVRSATFDDGDSAFVYCDGHSAALPGSVAVTGQMQEAGSVAMYDYQQSATAPWSFQLAVPPGTRDLLATGNGKVVIRRDLAIDGATTLPPLDVDRDGTAIVPVQLSLDGVQPQEAITTEVDLYAANNLAFGPPGEGAIAQTLPASLLRASDQVDLYVTTTSANGLFTRVVDTWFTGNETHFQLMPTLGGVTLDGATARWTALPPHTEVRIDLLAETATTYSAERISASQAWLDETGESELALGDLPPKFQSAWTIDAAQPHTTSFTARDDSTAIAYETAINDAPAVARRSRQLSGASRKILP